MTPLAKSLFVSLSIAVLVAGTLALRGKAVPRSGAALTAEQLAEIAPPQKPEPPKASARPVEEPSDLPPPPDEEPDVADGEGS